jgi:hypothetical protein
MEDFALKKVLIAVSTLSLLALGLFFLPQTVQAAAPDQVDRGTLLENYYMREKIALNDQEARLTFSRNVAQKAQTWIDNLDSQGQDTTDLKNALAAFQQGIDSAQSSHDTAASILSTHAGFDDSGQVSDKTQALQTLRDAGKALRQAHLTISQATLDIRSAVQAYRSANQS